MELRTNFCVDILVKTCLNFVVVVVAGVICKLLDLNRQQRAALTDRERQHLIFKAFGD